mmetsp:Transcript_8764/g.19892  ORF Transcript_8764/g.19892 Transcript_8764/m.19892 type:complete len:359 (-) Transcript_8764:510-1586(-)
MASASCDSSFILVLRLPRELCSSSFSFCNPLTLATDRSASFLASVISCVRSSTCLSSCFSLWNAPSLLSSLALRFRERSLSFFSSAVTFPLLSASSLSSSLILSFFSFTSFTILELFAASSSRFFFAARTSSSFPFTDFSSTAIFFLNSSKSFPCPASALSPDFLISREFFCSRLSFSASNSSFSLCIPAILPSMHSTSLRAAASFSRPSLSCSSSASQPEQLLSCWASSDLSLTLEAEKGRMICMLPPFDLLACDKVARSSSRSSVSFRISTWAVCRASTADTCSLPFSIASWCSSLAFSTRLSSTLRRVLHPRPIPPRNDCPPPLSSITPPISLRAKRWNSSWRCNTSAMSELFAM